MLKSERYAKEVAKFVSRYVPETSDYELCQLWAYAPPANENEKVVDKYGNTKCDKYGRSKDDRRIIAGKRLYKLFTNDELITDNIGPDFLADGISNNPPGSKGRVADLAAYYNSVEGRSVSAFEQNEFESLRIRATDLNTSKATAKRMGELLKVLLTRIKDEDRLNKTKQITNTRG